MVFLKTKINWNTNALTIFCVIMAQVTGVAATNNSDIIGMAVAGCVSFVLLSVVLSIGVVFFFWTPWFKKWMHHKGKVKMSKAYFLKKEEAKRKLIDSQKLQVLEAYANVPVQSVNGGESQTKTASHYNTPNGTHAPTANGIHITVDKPATKISSSSNLRPAWHKGTPSYANRIYEEKNATLELGEEIDEEYNIETEVVDNEILDVGPFKHDHSSDVPIKGDVYPDPYIYSTVDRTVKPSQKITDYSVKSAKATPALKKTPTQDTTHLDVEYSTAGEIKTSKFEQSLLYL